MQTHSYLNKCSKAEAWSCVPKPCSAWAAQAAGRERSRNLLISQGEHIRISLEEGNKAGGLPPSLLSRGIFYSPSGPQQTQSTGSPGGAAAAGVQRLAALAWVAGTWWALWERFPGRHRHYLQQLSQAGKQGFPHVLTPQGLPMIRQARLSQSCCC